VKMFTVWLKPTRRFRTSVSKITVNVVLLKKVAVMAAFFRFQGGKYFYRKDD